MKKRYAQVGIGGRSLMYTKAARYTYSDYCELVGFCDTNQGRMDLRNKELTEGDTIYFKDLPKTLPVKTYMPDEFEKMIKEQKVDVVIVTTKDCYHDGYIIRAMKAGCDVITEKPMTINAGKCQNIIDTIEKTGKNLKVTFNYRYSPVRSQVKELLMKNVIGEILSVDFSWNLNTSHGADYFRRWHRNMVNSGGLLVHKATHHFDLVNWWISAVPAEVFCFASRQFYTPEQAERYGLKNRTDRCHTCPESKNCKFFLDMEKNENLKKLYLDQEKYDGYIRDKCVFGKDIDIYDSMNLVVKYNTGVLMSYALNAFMPWEGYAIDFNGTKGRLEHKSVETVYISGDGTTPGELIKKGTGIIIHPHFAEPYNVPIKEVKGGHGGGDDPLLNNCFNPNPEPDTLKRSAGVAEGAYSILTGIAGNESIKTGKVIHISDLVCNIPKPIYL